MFLASYLINKKCRPSLVRWGLCMGATTLTWTGRVGDRIRKQIDLDISLSPLAEKKFPNKSLNNSCFSFIFHLFRPRLEFYVQACAVDIVTKGCAGPPSICRRAVLDILGTDLRTTCTCRTAQHLGDMAAMYDCTEWQRLLWLNPCVGRWSIQLN